MKRARKLGSAHEQGFLRFALAFVTWFAGLGYLASITHMAFVAHSACAEHGELVHVQSGAQHADPTEGSASRVSERDTVASDEHDHCAAAATKPAQARASQPPVSVAVLDSEPLKVEVVPLAGSAPRLALAPPIPLLLLSPKSSPPA